MQREVVERITSRAVGAEKVAKIMADVDKARAAAQTAAKVGEVGAAGVEAAGAAGTAAETAAGVASVAGKTAGVAGKMSGVAGFIGKASGVTQLVIGGYQTVRMGADAEYRAEAVEEATSGALKQGYGAAAEKGTGSLAIGVGKQALWSGLNPFKAIGATVSEGVGLVGDIRRDNSEDEMRRKGVLELKYQEMLAQDKRKRAERAAQAGVKKARDASTETSMRDYALSTDNDTMRRLNPTVDRRVFDQENRGLIEAKEADARRKIEEAISKQGMKPGVDPAPTGVTDQAWKNWGSYDQDYWVKQQAILGVHQDIRTREAEARQNAEAQAAAAQEKTAQEEAQKKAAAVNAPEAQIQAERERQAQNARDTEIQRREAGRLPSGAVRGGGSGGSGRPSVHESSPGVTPLGSKPGIIPLGSRNDIKKMPTVLPPRSIAPPPMPPRPPLSKAPEMPKPRHSSEQAKRDIFESEQTFGEFGGKAIGDKELRQGVFSQLDETTGKREATFPVGYNEKGETVPINPRTMTGIVEQHPGSFYARRGLAGYTPKESGVFQKVRDEKGNVVKDESGQDKWRKANAIDPTRMQGNKVGRYEDEQGNVYSVKPGQLPVKVRDASAVEAGWKAREASEQAARKAAESGATPPAATPAMPAEVPGNAPAAPQATPQEAKPETVNRATGGEIGGSPAAEMTKRIAEARKMAETFSSSAVGKRSASGAASVSTSVGVSGFSGRTPGMVGRDEKTNLMQFEDGGLVELQKRNAGIESSVNAQSGLAYVMAQDPTIDKDYVTANFVPMYSKVSGMEDKLDQAYKQNEKGFKLSLPGAKQTAYIQALRKQQNEVTDPAQKEMLRHEITLATLERMNELSLVAAKDMMKEKEAMVPAATGEKGTAAGAKGAAQAPVATRPPGPNDLGKPAGTEHVVTRGGAVFKVGYGPRITTDKEGKREFPYYGPAGRPEVQDNAYKEWSGNPALSDGWNAPIVTRTDQDIPHQKNTDWLKNDAVFKYMTEDERELGTAAVNDYMQRAEWNRVENPVYTRDLAPPAILTPSEAKMRAHDTVMAWRRFQGKARAGAEKMRQDKVAESKAIFGESGGKPLGAREFGAGVLSTVDEKGVRHASGLMTGLTTTPEEASSKFQGIRESLKPGDKTGKNADFFVQTGDFGFKKEERGAYVNNVKQDYAALPKGVYSTENGKRYVSSGGTKTEVPMQAWEKASVATSAAGVGGTTTGVPGAATVPAGAGVPAVAAAAVAAVSEAKEIQKKAFGGMIESGSFVINAKDAAWLGAKGVPMVTGTSGDSNYFDVRASGGGVSASMAAISPGEIVIDPQRYGQNPELWQSINNGLMRFADGGFVKQNADSGASMDIARAVPRISGGQGGGGGSGGKFTLDVNLNKEIRDLLSFSGQAVSQKGSTPLT
jgi:hypothetical protein